MARYAEQVAGGQVVFVGTISLRPPDITELIGHSAEIFARFLMPGTGMHETEYMLRVKQQQIQKKSVIGKIKGGITGIQRPQQAGANVQ